MIGSDCVFVAQHSVFCWLSKTQTCVYLQAFACAYENQSGKGTVHSKYKKFPVIGNSIQVSFLYLINHVWSNHCQMRPFWDFQRWGQLGISV